MTKSNLIEKVRERLKDYPKKDVAFATDIIFQAMTDALARDEKVEVRGFGNFTVRARNSRKGRNPRTGAVINVASRKVPFFRVGKALRNLINGW
jgi:Bacterial nucleoid DNA-binding protein